MPPPAIAVSVDGPATLWVDGRGVALSRSERIVLAGLLLSPDRGTDTETMLDLRWPGEVPRTARQALHNTISALRRKGGLTITNHDDRYHLGGGVCTDRHRLEDIPPDPSAATGGMSAASVLTRCPRWFAELPDVGVVRAARAGLDAQLRAVRSRSLESLKRAGRLADAAALAHVLRLTDSGDESAWATEISLLAAAGRRLDAASTFRAACRTLANEHGLEPGPRLRAVEAALWDGTRAPTDGHRGRSARPRERDDLRTLLAAGHTVLVVGPKWVGKSHLAADIAVQWPVGVRQVACADSRRRPLMPLLEPLAPVPPTILEPIRRGAVDRTALDRLVEFIVDALDDTMLLVLDDVDRLAPLSREVLGMVLGRTAVRVLATSRRAITVPGRDDVHAVALRPLDVDSIAMMAETDHRTSRELLQLTGGNPGVVVLLLDALQRSAIGLEALPRLVDLEQVPAPVVDALASRLAGLSAATRATVEHIDESRVLLLTALALHRNGRDVGEATTQAVVAYEAAGLLHTAPLWEPQACTALAPIAQLAGVALPQRERTDRGLPSPVPEDLAEVLQRRHGLRPREAEVVLALRTGGTNAEIAKALSVSESTVRKHLQHAYATLEVRSRAEALVFLGTLASGQPADSIHGRKAGPPTTS